MPPTHLANRYRLESEIGQGGMGTIYRAHDELLDRAVAVKVLGESGLGAEGQGRLLREARAAAQLNHPNIVSVYDAGEADGKPYIVMELVEGESLYTRWPLPLADIVAITRQICAALEHAHGHGIIHRDLKPENVLLTAQHIAKLTDFGLARSVSSRLTTEGSVIGTVFYLAPEMVLGQELDGRADLYALGVLLYEMTTGKLPFTGDDPVTVISQHLYASAVPPRAHNADIPLALESVILRLLSKNPDDRPPSADAVAQLLEHWDSGSAAEAEAQATLSVLDRIVRGRMVGRERELGEAATLWRRAVAGEGHVLLVSGEPGIGKSRLVRELTALAEVSGATVLRGECYAEGGAPYSPLAQMWRELKTSHRLVAEGEPASGRVVTLPAPVLAALFSIAPDSQTDGSAPQRESLLDAQAEQQRLFEAGVTLIHQLTAAAPVMLVLEDAHWADSGSLFALRHIARRSAHRRLLIVITYREVEIDEACCLPDVLHDLNRERLSTRLKLTRLSRAQVHSLLAVMFGLTEAEITAELLDGLYRETEGNPFFLEEVCKALLEDGQIYYAGGQWQRVRADELRIPQSVRVTIQSRLSKLPEPAQEALRLASVLGREFDFDTLQTASGVAEDTLIDALERAARAQLVAEARNGHELRFTFAHALIPSTLREGMSGPRLRMMHRKAAAAVARTHPEDFESLAYHASQAGDDDSARDHFRRAGDRALNVFANQEAERHYRSALDLCPLEGDGNTLEKGLLYAGLGEALFRQARFAEGQQAWQKAIERFTQAGDFDRAAHCFARKARAAWYEGDAARGLAVALAGMQAIPPEPETAGLAELLHEAGRAYLFNGADLRRPSPEVRKYCERALAMAQRFGLIDIQAESLTTLALVVGQSTPEGMAMLRQAIDLAEPVGLYAAAGRAYFNLSGGVLDGTGDFKQGFAYMRHAADLYRRTGQTLLALDTLLQAEENALLFGDFNSVERSLESVRQEARSLPNAESVLLAANAVQAGLLMYRGEWEQAAELIQSTEGRARELSAKSKHLRPGSLLMTQAFIAMESERWQSAAETLRQLLSDSDFRVGNDEVGPLTILTLVLARGGDLGAARAALAEAKTIAGDPPKLFAPLQLHWAEGEVLLQSGNLDEAIAHMQAALAEGAAQKMPWFEARLRERCADIYRLRQQPGDAEQAAQHLRQALAIFENLRAPRYADRVRAELQSLNLQPTAHTLN
jgi:predicted ATPase